MALRGNLRDFSVFQMLNLISVARKTGTLEIDGAEAQARLSFEKGRLLYAAVDGHDCPLTEMLQHGGKLSEAQAREIEARASSGSDREMAWLLLRSGHISRADIIRSVRAHVLRNVFQVFEWSEGTFEFESNRPSFSDRIAVPIDLANVIVAGSRRLREARFHREAIPDLDVPLRFTRGAGARLRKMRMGLDEWRVISMVGPGSTVREIAKLASLSEDQVRRIVCGLLQAGLVQLEPRDESLAQAPSGARQQSKGPMRRAPVRRNVVLRLIDRIRKL